MTIKIPPNSREAEQAVIGACLIDPAVIDDVREILDPSDWYASDHRAIWTEMLGLADAGESVDVLTLRDRLEGTRGVALAYLAELADSTPGTSNAASYARIVRECGERREIISAANRAADIAYNERNGGARALAEFASVGGERQTGHIEPIKEMARGWLETIDARVNGTDVGLRVGFRDLDSRWSGLRGGDLVVLAGRPKMGKTTLAMAIAENVADGGTALFFSLEMSRTQIMDRTASRFSRVPLRALRSGDLMADDWPRLTTGMSHIAGLSLLVDDSAALHISDLRSRARAQHRKTPLSLIAIDYLQLLRSDGENQNLRVADITAQCKALAKELDIPVILLSQLSRKCEERKNRRPLPSDLRDSGSIEQDADYVVFVYRHEVYDENTPRRGVMEVITSLARMSEPGTDYLSTDLARSTLSSVSEDFILPAESDASVRSYAGGRDL